MKRFNFLMLAFITLAFSVCFSSCGPDDEESIKVDVYLACSEDFLQFLTPVLHYYDPEGNEQKLELSKSDMTLDVDNAHIKDLSLDGNPVNAETAQGYYYVLSLHYDSWQVTDKVWVTFRLNGEGNVREEGKAYYFFTGIPMVTSTAYLGDKYNENVQSFPIEVTLADDDDELFSYWKSMIWWTEIVMDLNVSASTNKQKVTVRRYQQ